MSQAVNFVGTRKILLDYKYSFTEQVDGALEGGKKIPLLDIGAGVYPTTLFFNHSCSPNTLRINQGTRVRNFESFVVLLEVFVSFKIIIIRQLICIFYKFQVIFIAKRNIRKDEEVTECYGIHHLSMDKQARQEKLKRGYAFDCACQVTNLI